MTSPLPPRPPPPSHICAVCRYVLDWRENYRGDTFIEGHWEHGGPMRDADSPEWGRFGPHEPEPIPEAEAEKVSHICDFCSAPNPVWMYPCASFNAGTQIVPGAGGGIGSETYVSEDAWGACDDCHADIEADRWGWVADRMLTRAPRELRILLRPQIKALHAEFRKHRSGPAVREPD
jgi:hypothetical protein